MAQVIMVSVISTISGRKPGTQGLNIILTKKNMKKVMDGATSIVCK